MDREITSRIQLKRRYVATPEQVFDSWTDPGKIGAWMFGPAVRDEEVVHLATDPRAGGGFSFVVRRNGEEIEHIGKYLEVNRPGRLAFTWGTAEDLPDTTQVTIEINPADLGAELTLTHRLNPNWEGDVRKIEVSWSKMLDALGRALE